jgi:ABC-type nitrate/sulfonate/bicarbonate transport system substrate-binding protein
VTFREVGDSDFRQGLTRKVYDFVWVFDAWDTIRLADIDKLPLAHLPFAEHTDCIPDWYTPVLATSQARIEKDPAQVQSFMEITARGYRAAMGDPQAAADALLAGAPELDRNLVERSSRYLSTRYSTDPAAWGRQDPQVWRRFVDFLVQQGLVDKGFDVSAAYTNRFVPTAAAAEAPAPTS